MLAGLAPSRSVHVRTPLAMTDGQALMNGRPWDYAPSSHFTRRRGYVEYDLGARRSIGAIWILADHNDTYHVQVSDDGRSFDTLWVIPEARGRGFQPRFEGGLGTATRYLRIGPLEGDDRYAISEVRVYEEPRAEPPDVPRIAGYVPGRTFRSRTLVFGLALVAWLLLSVARSPRWWRVLAALFPLVAGAQLVSQLVVEWPIGSREVSLVRGTVAAVAASAVALEAFAVRLRPGRGVVLAVLAICGAIAFMAFYNLGHPQFYDHDTEERTFAHYLDLRQYYTTAKYFDEIGYSGIYAADVAAYLENVPGASMERLARTPMRDLETLRVSSVADQGQAIAEAPRWFAEDRWEEYKRDTEFFRRAMGDRSYLETLVDMGGNATPVWIATTHLLFNAIDPSDLAFTLTGLVDVVLILLALIAVGRTFGPRTMLVCMVVFGANDFIMYGTNWGGATLRHDWMAYLAFGLCSLKKERYALGGALFAASAMIRAFPALALAGAALPALWWLVDYRRSQGRFPPLSVIQIEQHPFVRIVAGASAAAALLFVFSIAVLPGDAWMSWIQKVGRLSSGTQANHISLRLFLSGSESAYRTLLERMPLFVAAIAAMVLLVIAGARRASPLQAALLGLMLIPAVFYPANYYSHFVWLLPMLAVERPAKSRPVRPADALIWVTLLLMCSVQYFAVLAPDQVLRFWLNSALLFASLSTLLVVWRCRDALDAVR